MGDSRLSTTYRGLVSNVVDPEGLRRIQCVIPSVFGATALSGWLWPINPQIPAPPVGAYVYVQFENGDPNNGLYNAVGSGGQIVPATSAASGAGSLTLGGLGALTYDYAGAYALAKVWSPPDSGLLAASSDPQYIPGGNLLSGGVIQLIQLQFPRGGTVANLLYGVQTAGTALTSGQCWIGLYNSAGTLISNAVDQTTNFGSANDKTVAITVRAGQSLTIPAGSVAYVALLSNATTTQVSLWSPGSQSTAANINLAAGSYRYCQSGSAQSTLPTSITLSSATRTRAYWAAAS